MTNLNINENDNGNEKKHEKPAIWFVDQEAQRLVDKYENPQGWLLYCRAINYIPQSTLIKLEKMSEKGKKPGHLFTTLLSQELVKLNATSKKYNNRLDKFKRDYGEF